MTLVPEALSSVDCEHTELDMAGAPAQSDVVHATNKRKVHSTTRGYISCTACFCLRARDYLHTNRIKWFPSQVNTVIQIRNQVS